MVDSFVVKNNIIDIFSVKLVYVKPGSILAKLTHPDCYYDSIPLTLMVSEFTAPGIKTNRKIEQNRVKYSKIIE